MRHSTFFQFSTDSATSPSISDEYGRDLFVLLTPEVETDPTRFGSFMQGVSPFTLHPASDTLKQRTLAGTHAAARNFLRAHGRHSLYVGFPFIFIKTNTYGFVAPLFLWPITLEPQLQGAPLWFLNRRTQSSAILNPKLRLLLEESDPFGLADRLSEQPKLSTWDSVHNLLQTIQPGMAMENHTSPTLHPFPEEIFASEMSEGVRVQYCGTIGIYPTTYAASNATFKIPQPSEIAHRTYFPGPGSLDPDQATAVLQAAHQTHTVVIGGMGTGKKHLAAHLAIAGLAQGETSLIISPDIYALQHIQSQLEGLGLSTLGFLFKDPAEDVVLLKQTVQAEANTAKSVRSFDQKGFDIQLDRLRRTKDKLDAAYQAVRTPLLGTAKWATLTGQYLQSSQIAGKELLAAHLNASEYHFDDAEYTHLKEVIPNAQALFAGIQTLNHPLRKLHHQLFLHTEKAEAVRQVEHKTRAFEKRVATLLYRFLSGINLYGDTLRSALEVQHRETSLLVQNLEETMQDYTLELGSNWYKIHPTRLTLTALVSPRAKRITEAREAIMAHIMQLEQRRIPLEKLGFHNPPPLQTTLLVELPSYIETYKKQLSDWLDRRTIFVQEELLRLSSNTAHQEILPPDLIRALEVAMNELIEELNNAQLLEHNIENQLLTLIKQQKLLTELLEQLENLRQNLQDFPKVYDWQRFWLPLPERAKKIVRALAHLKPPNWNAVFESWYLDQVLFQRQHLALPREALPLGNFRENWQQIQDALPQYIQQRWQPMRAQGIRTLSKLWNAKQPMLSIPSKPFLQVYPIILATLDSASAFMQALPDVSFDHLLLLHAEHIPTAACASLLQLGKHVRVFGDVWPQIDTHTYSLLHSVVSENWPTTTLSYIHHLHGSHPLQLKHPEKITERASDHATKTHLIYTPGGFNSDTQTNTIEAQRIIEYLLHQLPVYANRAYPITAIVASTPAQRDYIAQNLIEIKRTGGKEAERIQQLERNGFGVYTLDEIHHLKTELLLVSCTWSAPQDTIGVACDLSSMYHLQGIATIASVYFHSFSTETLNTLCETGTAHPLGFLANALLLLNYSNDSTAQQHILNRFTEGMHQQAQYEPDHCLLKYMARALRPYLSHTDILPAYTLAHLELPLYLPDCLTEGSPAGIYLDGFFAQTPATDYCWELEQAQKYAAHGIQLFPTWSVNWWKQPDQEPRRLAAQLLRPKP